MSKITYRLLIYLVLWLLSSPITANSMFLDEYAWTNRLIILITSKRHTNLEKQVERFFENNECNIDERNIKLLHFHSNEPALIQLPKTMRLKTGLWLLGYDGLIKDFSEDGQLLNRLFQTIDGMPIRQEEMKSRRACD